ncbi:MAG TPA: type II toxin-antitoxin system RelE/ParE family toxin [Pyrinomonadaceae bacterium]|jgi:plasmid stabilization system protein ParE|nr:type II toxin-antitoxin system RelE/ParE family toxin [Pyrinomonadaceae bacterium]
MNLPIVTRPKAAAEIDAAYRWYERERRGLGEEFLVALTQAVAVIAGNPERFPIVHRDTRRVLLSRFPYSICYRLKRGHVVVVACFHSKRNPEEWKSRR